MALGEWDGGWRHIALEELGGGGGATHGTVRGRRHPTGCD